MFFLPNLFTLILFAYVANYARQRFEGYTVMDALQNSPKYQRAIHLAVYMLIVLCSTCTQIIGMQMLLSGFTDNKVLVAASISFVCLLLVWNNGLKSSIITDTYKYVVMFICAGILLFSVKGDYVFTGVSNVDTVELFKSFGLITALGLLSGVYSDMTLWQRAFSIPKENIKKTFIQSGLYFAIIPLMFGVIGFASGNSGVSWSLSNEFSSGYLNVVLIVCVTATLMATLDSNLCASAAIPCKVFDKGINYGRLAMTLVLFIACILTSLDLFSLNYMFLTYNTVRASIAIPALLIIFNMYNPKRLFIATLIAVVVAPIGYVMTQNWLFTLFGFLMPLLGVRINFTKKG